MNEERDCMNCVHKHPDGNCGSWDCEYINRREAIEAWRAMKGKQIETVIRCKDCKRSDWYEILNGEHRCYCMEHRSGGHTDDDYCSYGERKDGESE